MIGKNQMHRHDYCLFTTGPMDSWPNFIHISTVHVVVFKFFAENPYHGYTYSAVWNSIMSKLHWAWCVCKEVDKDLRNFDIWIDLHLYEENFDCSIMFKSDNNGTVNLIMDNNFDVKSRVLEIPHEYQCEWEFVCIS
jgi:hypothetical protein